MRSLLPFLSLALCSAAQVTNYVTTGSAVISSPTPCIGAGACDASELQPLRDLPEGRPPFNNAILVQLFSGGMANLSIPQGGHFMGFSIELSVAFHILGPDAERINPIFLNLMDTITSRAGKAWVRVGGNSQDRASLVMDGLPKGASLEKLPELSNSTTRTPVLRITPGIIHAMSAISDNVPVEWFFGVPFNDTNDPRSLIGEISQQVLGNKLIGLQMSNEPDLYFRNGIRGADYNPQQFHADWGVFLNHYLNDRDMRNVTQFIAPSVCCGNSIGWTPEQVFETGFLDTYQNNLGYISVQHYPTDNCNGSGRAIDPQGLLGTTFLNHNDVQNQMLPYVNTAQLAAQHNKPLIMFETNTASCGGFAGLSNTYMSTQWAVDYSLTLAFGNFTSSLFHVGGQSDFYNPFTPPATNQTKIREWTVGPTFYASLIMAEALGKSGNARVTDLFLNGNDAFTAGYAIYENDQPARVVLFNYLTDPTGAHNYTANIAIGGLETGQPFASPGRVRVKYFLADSVTEKFNMTWAGQNFGGAFESDGRLRGEEQVYEYQCFDGFCGVPMPAPAIALVFLTDEAFQGSSAEATQTFATSTTATGAANTASVAQDVLQTSNGRGGGNWDQMGATSFGSVVDSARSAFSSVSSPAIITGFAILAGVGAVFSMRM